LYTKSTEVVVVIERGGSRGHNTVYIPPAIFKFGNCTAEVSAANSLQPKVVLLEESSVASTQKLVKKVSSAQMSPPTGTLGCRGFD